MVFYMLVPPSFVGDSSALACCSDLFKPRFGAIRFFFTVQSSSKPKTMDNRRYVGFLPDICARDLGCVIWRDLSWAGTSPFFFMTSFRVVENFPGCWYFRFGHGRELKVLP